jgi:hypothetical protein
VIEARNSVAYVRGIFQRLLALLGESELGCGYPITSWVRPFSLHSPRLRRTPSFIAIDRLELAWLAFAIIFLPREHPPAHGRPGTLYHVGLRQLFQLLPRGLVDSLLPRGFGHARLIHFLFDASECRLVGFLRRLVFMHTCTMSRVQRDYRSIWNRAGSFRIVFIRAVLNSLYQSAKCSISNVKQRAPVPLSHGRRVGLSKTNSVRRSAEGIT